jgi:hypothetical protein
MRTAFENHVFFRANKWGETPLFTDDQERRRDDLKRLDYCVAVTNACVMLPLSSNQLMVLREQPEAMPA